ncbi:hypothetical protein COCNU_contig69246064G000010 [Cocos nucifera]|nr:hypothetical protein [Cocos nucifera]
MLQPHPSHLSPFALSFFRRNLPLLFSVFVAAPSQRLVVARLSNRHRPVLTVVADAFANDDANPTNRCYCLPPSTPLHVSIGQETPITRRSDIRAHRRSQSPTGASIGREAPIAGRPDDHHRRPTTGLPSLPSSPIPFASHHRIDCRRRPTVSSQHPRLLFYHPVLPVD